MATQPIPSTNTKVPHLNRPNSYQKISVLIKEKKMASYLTLTLTFVTLSFFGLFAIRPTLITAISLTKSVAELADLKNKYENKIGDIIRSQSEYEKIREYVPLIDTALPSTPSFDTFSQGLERLAEKNSVIISQIQIDPVSLSKTPFTGRLKQYNFTLSGRGTYQTINSYIKDLLKWKRITTISNLDLAQGDTTSGSALRVNMKGTTFYEP